MSASTPTAPAPLKLRSPFSVGELYVVPPDASPAFIAALLERGFTRLDDDPKKKGKP
jgi:hypothetical protein